MSFTQDNIDFNKVIQAIKNESLELNSTDFESVKDCVYIAANEYAEQDFNECEILSVERTFSNIAEGTIDLSLKVINPIKYPKKLRNKVLGVDWKTANREVLDSIWKKKYKLSWQWKIYSHYDKADYFQYRGISKSSGDTNEILLEVPENNSLEVNNYLIDLNLMRNALRDSAVWPKHMPYACDAYSEECPFKRSICLTNKNHLYKINKEEPFHYTTSETFLLCPEKYRLETALNTTWSDEVGLRNQNVIFGSAFHAGMEEIYKQLLEKQKHGN